MAQTVAPVAETKDAPTIVRSGPSEDFDRIVELPKGLRLAVVSTVAKGWSEVRLSSRLSGWVENGSLDMLPLNENASPSHPIIKDIVIKRFPGFVRMEILESEPGVVIPWEELYPRKLRLEFENAQSALFEIDYDPRDPLIEQVADETVAEDVVSLNIDLKNFYGYHLEQKDPTHLLVIFQLKPPSGSLKGWTICIDPGHGGKDTGAVGPTGLDEKEVTLSVAAMLGRMLVLRGAKVIFTRKTDEQVLGPKADPAAELEARVDAARRAGANLFLSIHCNARPTKAEGRTARGSLVYYYQPQSLGLAWDIERGLVAQVHEPKSGVIFRSFHVIRESDMPAVLAETVFISNPQIEAKLKNLPYRRRIALGLLNGLLKYARSLK